MAFFCLLLAGMTMSTYWRSESLLQKAREGMFWKEDSMMGW